MTMRCGILLRLTWKRGENRLELVHGKAFLVYLNSFRIALLTWCYHVKRFHRVRYHKGDRELPDRPAVLVCLLWTWGPGQT
eukprot:6384153-Amphidinium_carterae.2